MNFLSESIGNLWKFIATKYKNVVPNLRNLLHEFLSLIIILWIGISLLNCMRRTLKLSLLNYGRVLETKQYVKIQQGL